MEIHGGVVQSVSDTDGTHAPVTSVALTHSQARSGCSSPRGRTLHLRVRVRGTAARASFHSVKVERELAELERHQVGQHRLVREPLARPR